MFSYIDNSFYIFLFLYLFNLFYSEYILFNIYELCSNATNTDALGKNTMTKNEEFFIESSSGFDDKGKVNYSLDDTLKLLVECNNSLLHIKPSMNNSALICKFFFQRPLVIIF